MQLKLDAETRTRAEADARRIASATDAKRTADEERARAVAAAQTAARIPAPATQPVAPPPVAAAIIPAPAPPPPAAAPQPAPAPVVAAPAPPPPAPVASIWPRLLGAITVPADTSAEAARYIARGRQEKATGDLNAARLFFERAADLKSPAGAVEMALTYDPEALREPAVAAVTSIRGEPAQARTWYQRAESLGAKGLAARIQALPAN